MPAIISGQIAEKGQLASRLSNAARIRIATCLALVATPLLAASAINAAAMTNISTATRYTQTPNSTVIFRMDISSYFSSNGMNANSPALLFPDNGVVQAYGLDPGNCILQVSPFGSVCINYRFRCEALLPASTWSNSSVVFDLVDLNALFLRKSDDPPGTCYLSPYMNAAGQMVLGITAIVTYEPQLGVADRIGTMGWYSVLAEGAKALQPGNCITFAVEYNPRPGDPVSFTWGDGTTILQDVFQLIAVGNAVEPVQVNGVSAGVFERQSP